MTSRGLCFYILVIKFQENRFQGYLSEIVIYQFTFTYCICFLFISILLWFSDKWIYGFLSINVLLYKYSPLIYSNFTCMARLKLLLVIVLFIDNIIYITGSLTTQSIRMKLHNKFPFPRSSLLNCVPKPR